MAEGIGSYDIVVLGGGSGGYACALRAAELGMSVVEGDQETLLDAERIGATGARVVQVNTGAEPQKAGVAPHSAGTPKLTMRSEAEAAPFDTGDLAVQVAEEDPFADTAPHVDFEDPFAPPAVHDQDRERAELEELLANARAIVASLETALERARENERKLAARVRP